MSINWTSYPFFIEEEAYGLWLEINGRKEFIRSVEAQSNDEIDIKKYRGVICAYVTAYEHLKMEILKTTIGKLVLKALM